MNGSTHHREPKAPARYRRFLTVCSLMTILLLAGCGSVPVQPFEAFSQSMLELSQGTDKALAELIPVSEARFKAELIESLDEASESDEALDDALDRLKTLRLSAESLRAAGNGPQRRCFLRG